MDREQVRELGRRGGEASHGGRSQWDNGGNERGNGRSGRGESRGGNGRSSRGGNSGGSSSGQRGFATMSRRRVREIASMGGRASARSRSGRVSSRRRSRSSR
jgi:hypothetical protein